jgi:hypothetical protein
MTSELYRQQMLGAPFKPYFGLSGITALDALCLSVHPIWRLLIKVTALPFVIPSAPGFPATLHWTQPRVWFSAGENRMKSANAVKINRKSGVAEGSAVRPGSRTKVSLPLVLPQNRHR